jgi:hypothetical protein
MSIIQQLEDLKEWSQDSTRYERRLAFRGNTQSYVAPRDPGGTIPIEWDELSDREREYYRTGPWSTREDYRKGQLVQPGPGRQGYQGVKSGSRPTSKPGGWKSRYKIKAFDKVADLFLNTYAKDDIDILYKVSKEIGNQISLIAKEPELLKHVSKQSGLSEKDIFDIIDDRKAHADLRWDVKTQEGIDVWNKPKKDLDNRMRNWLMKNSKKYADPEKFKKSFNRVFGKNNYINKAIKKDSLKRGTMLGFVDDNFVKTYISSGIKNPEDYTFKSRQLDDMFKTLIYNNNENVRNKVVKTFTDILPKERVTKSGVLDVYKAIKNNDFLKKFKLNEGINGPVARLIARSLDKDLVRQIDNFKKPYMGTRDLLNYLGDHVDSEYKSMFKEAEQAVVAMQSDKWSVARKNLDTGREIMFDHKIPSSLIEAGYADDIEYIKMNPTSQEFNVNIKAKKFDRPMNTLVRKFEKAKTLDAKTKIYEEMVAKKDAFSKKYGNYLDEVKITMDEKGKLKFASDAPVVTKKTDLTKMLKTSLEQQKFPTMDNKQQMNFLKKMGYRCRRSTGGGETVACYMSDVEKTRADMKSPNVEVRAKALTKQRGALKIASKIPQIGKILKTGIQAGTAAITAPLKWLGLTSGIGYAIEGIVEGGFYDNARRKGYTHEQAFAETFSPRLIKEGVEGKSTEDVPWYGGAETLLEQELIGDPKQNPKVAQYVDALKEQDRIYDLIGKKEALKDQPTTTDETLFIPGDLDAASADVQDLARSGAYRRVDQTLKPESMAAQAYETAVERQKGRQDQRRREYLEKYDPGALKYEERTLSTPRQLEKRYEAMEEKYPTYTREELEQALEAWGVDTPWDAGFASGVKGYDEMGEWLKTHDKYKAMEAGVANMAGGGIAGIRRPWAIPPESGPDPYGGGLSSQYNRVKKLTG